MAEVAKVRRARRGEQAWRELLAGQKRSGLSVQAYCERQGLSEANFYRWRTKIQGAVLGKAVGAAVSIPEFIDAGPLRREVDRRSGLDLRLDLGEGWVLHLVRR